MARIVCQVLHRADRITFIWSERSASFEPYHLEGGDRAALLTLAGQIHAKLASPDSPDLTPLGQQLYRLIFRMDASDYGSAATVQSWLTGLMNAGSIEKIEFLSDSPGLIPWNVLVDDPAAGFWGRRFNLGAGRRVNTLRQNPAQENPGQLYAADPQLAEQLTEDQRILLQATADERPVASIGDLEARIADLAPDIVLLLVRFAKGQLWLGGEAFRVADLERWLSAPRDGNPDPLVVLLGCGQSSPLAPREDADAWQTLLADASATFSGLIANEALLPASDAFAVGHAFAQRFAEGKHDLGEILRVLRQENASALAFSGFCPPQVRAVAEGAADAPGPELPMEAAPLPSRPYHPFSAYEPEDRALFFGRENDTVRCASALDQADTIGLILHGGPAVGKTSFLQAGIFPYLEQESLGFRFLRDRTPSETPIAEKDQPILVLRCTNDLAGQFADALLAFCAAPLIYTTPAGTQASVDLPAVLQRAVAGITAESATAIQPAASDAISTAGPSDGAGAGDLPDAGLSINDLWIALRDNKQMLGRILDAVTRALPFELVIAIDEGEELLTQVTSPQQQARRQRAIDMLAELPRLAPRCKLVFTIRTQLLGQFIGLFPDGRLPAGWSTFFLRPLTEQEMVDALVWPTNREPIPYSSEAPHHKYGFAFEDGMAAQMVADAIDAARADQQSPLPILQAVGALLYEGQVLAKKQHVLRTGDINDLGGVREAIACYLDWTLDRLPISASARQGVRDLIGKLYMSHTDGTLSRKIILASDLNDCWTSPGDPPADAVAKAAALGDLFHVDELFIGGTVDTYVSVSHDSLVQLGKKLDTEREKQAYAWTKIGDTLWIMIPLMFLAAAVTFWATRHYGGSVDRKEIEREVLKEIREEVTDLFNDNRNKTRQLALAQRQIYLGNIGLIDRALRAGDAPQAQKMLAMQMISLLKARGNNTPDPRGFEWSHLWHRLHSERFALEGHQGSIHAAAISPDSKKAATAGVDGILRIWNVKTGKSIASLAMDRKAVHAIAFAPDGKALATGGDDKMVRLWDISELKDDAGQVTKEPKKLEGHTEPVYAVAFGKDATELASGGADKSVIVWDLTSGKAKHTLKEQHSAKVTAVLYSSDGKTLLSAGDESRIVWSDPAAGTKRDAKETPLRTIAALALSADGKTLAAAGSETELDSDHGALRFWDLDSLKESPVSITHAAGFVAVGFGPDGQSVLSAGKDSVVRQWDLKSAKEMQQWVGHTGAIHALAVAKDGSAFLSVGSDGDAKIWNPKQSSAGVDVIAAHKDAIQALVLNHNNTLLASGARDGSVKLWDPKTAKLVLDLSTHAGAVTSLAFSGRLAREFGKAKDVDEFLLAVGTRNATDAGEIKIFQIKKDAKDSWTSKLLHTLPKQSAGVTCLAFSSADEKPEILISGSVDKTVKVWDAKAGELQKSHAVHKDEVRCIAFAHDGKNFFSGGKDGLVCVHELGSDTVQTLKDLHVGPIGSLVLFRAHKSRGDVHEVYIGVLTAGADQAVRVWAFNQHDRVQAAGKNPSLQTTFELRNHHVRCLAFHENSGSPILWGGSDGAIRIADDESERVVLTGHKGPVRALAAPDDQRFIASAGSDGTIRIWRTQFEPEPAKDEKK